MNKKIWLCTGVIFIVVGIFFGALALHGYLSEKEAKALYEKLQAEYATEQPSEETPVTTEEATEASTEEPLEIPIDFASLTEKNPDIYAWIQILGTDIDYPIVQHESDNTYYLYHTIDGEKKTAASIYTENYNSKDFTDANTLIYGHNMKNGTMFRQLHNFKDRKFFEENKEVIIYLPDKILHYQIFAAYTYDDRHILMSFDFEDEDVYRSYLGSIFSRHSMSDNIDDTVEVTTADSIITLSTCTSNSSQRYLVQAVLVQAEE